MIVFKSLENFKFHIRKDKITLRILEAFDNYKLAEKNVYYNIIDSLIFRYMENIDEKKKYLSASKRYLDIHYIIEGTGKIEIADKSLLNLKEKYNDENDKEKFHLKDGLEIKEVNEGSILIIEKNEAYRFLNNKDLKKIIVKFTTENDVF